MALFASLLAYLTATLGIIVAFVMSYCVLLGSLDQSTITQRPVAAAVIPATRPVASVSAEAKTQSSKESSPKPGQWGPPIVHGRPIVRKTQTAEVAARDKKARHAEWPNQWALRQEPGNGSPRMSYAQEPTFGPSLGRDGIW